MIRYKFLIQNKSKNGDHKWRLNKWYKIDGDLEMCHQLDNGDFTANGFHCSRENISTAMIRKYGKRCGS